MYKRKERTEKKKEYKREKISERERRMGK